jgi:purine-nucleoside phosphorylase
VTSDVFFRSRAAAASLGDRFEGRRPRLAVQLGSGLGAFADRLGDTVRVDFTDVPHHREPTTPGHAGVYVAGEVAGIAVVVSAGRLHGYEGYAPDDVTFPVRVLAALGVETLVLTNAAGGVDPSFAPGDLMLVEDHLNLTGANPLRGPNDDRLGPRFPDMTEVYDAGLRGDLEHAAIDVGIVLRRGVYAGVAGPSYETPAEIRMLRALGAHAVGMSTVHEAIVARHGGLRLACISCITNAAAGLAGSPLTHTEVTNTAERSSEALSLLLEAFVRNTAS